MFGGGSGRECNLDETHASPAPRACLLVSLAACSSTGEGSGEPPLRTAEPTVHVEADPQRTQPRSEDEDGEGLEYFLAVLGQTGIEHCDTAGGYEPTWLAVEPTLGFVPAGGEGLATLDEALYDQPVLARGRRAEHPPRPPLEIEPQPCGMMQMRSDWVTTPRGIRVVRSSDRSTLPDYFDTSSIRRLDELELRLEGDEVLVEFVNPLPVTLDRVGFVMHYEGCYGKPGTASREAPKVTLESGASTSHRFPLIVEKSHSGPRKGGRNARIHRAASLVLTLGGADGAIVHTDFALSLNDVGIAFDCP